MHQMYSTGEVARLLGIHQHQIDYAISSGYLPPPRTHFLGKRCFSKSEVEEIARHFGYNSRRPKEVAMFRFPYMTLTQLGQLFGVSSHQIGKWLRAMGLRTNENRPSRETFLGIT